MVEWYHGKPWPDAPLGRRARPRTSNAIWTVIKLSKTDERVQLGGDSEPKRAQKLDRD